MEKVLVFTDLCASADGFGLDLELAPGEFVALRELPERHESGLLSAAATLRRPPRGAVTICGQRAHFPHRERLLSLRCSIGYVGPGSALVSDLTLLGNLLLGHRYFDREAEAVERIGSLVKLLRLEPLLDLKPALLPFQVQRVAIYLRELAKGPRLMVLDHPGLGLGEQAARLLGEALREAKEQGMSGLLSAEAPFLGLADRVLVIEDGKAPAELVVESGGRVSAAAKGSV